MQLVPGVAVVGRVVDAEGRPVRSADLSSPLHVDLLDPLESLTGTDENGRFVLRDLGPGEFEVVVEGKKGSAKATLHGAPGETLEWNPVLSNGGTIRGRLVDERGEPVPGCEIHIEDEGPFRSDYCGQVWAGRTDNEGRFRVTGPRDHAHRVDAYTMGDASFPLASATGVVPDQGEIFLQISPSSRPTVWIAGTVVDENGAALANASLRAKTPEHRHRSRLALTDAEGHFELGPLPAGPWTLELLGPGKTLAKPQTLGPRELGSGETWDCGVVILEQE